MALTCTDTFVAGNWSADATWAVTGGGSGPQSGAVCAVVQSTGICTPAVNPVWTTNILIGHRFFLNGSYYTILSNTSTTVTISNPPANGNYNWAIGGQPLNSDNVVITGVVATMDIARIPVTGTLGTVVGSGAGSIAVNLAAAQFANDGAIFATSFTAGTVALISVSGAAVGRTLTVTGSVLGGSTPVAYGLYHNSTGTVVILDGPVTGGAASSASGAYNDSTGPLNITGPVNGSPTTANSYGVKNVSTGPVTVTGNVTGGNFTSSMGVYNNAAGAVMITGNVAGGSGATSHGLYNNTTGAVTVAGNVTGGAIKGAVGLFNYSTGPVTVTGKLIWSTKEAPISGSYISYTPAATDYIQTDAAGAMKCPKEPSASDVLLNVPVGTIVGNVTLPTAAQVKKDVKFGPSLSLTGTHAPVVLVED